VLSHRNLLTTAAVAALSAIPLSAVAQQTAYTTAPVAVKALHVNVGIASVAAAYDSNPVSFAPSTLDFSFVNNGNVAATKVTFLVDGTRSIEDRGTFAPGVTINREDAAGYGDLGRAQITVSEVDFADGSSWHAPGSSNLASAGR